MTSSDASPSFEPLIQLYASQGRWPEVRRYALEWLKSNPLNSVAHYWAAWAALKLGELKVAEQHARSMSLVDVSSSAALFLWAEIRLAKGEVQSALAAIRHALEIAPEAAYCHHTLCRVHLRKGEHPQALAAIEAALRLEPDDADYRALHGTIQRMAAATWSPAAAVQEVINLKEVLTLDPRNAWVRARIGQIYAQDLEDYNEASKFLQQSLEVDPTDGMVRHNLLEAQLRQDTVYRWFASPLHQLGLLSPESPHLCAPWFLLPVVFYATMLLVFGALLNLLWLWLPAQAYRHFVRADLCGSEATFRWQRTLYHRLAMVPHWLRLTGWIGVVFTYWCIQFVLLVTYAPWIFVPGISLGMLSLLFTWRVSREARQARKQLH